MLGEGLRGTGTAGLYFSESCHLGQEGRLTDTMDTNLLSKQQFIIRTLQVLTLVLDSLITNGTTFNRE